MKGKTRAYNNQWILQANQNLIKARYNIQRILEKVLEKGEYTEMHTVMNTALAQINYAQRQLGKLQFLFNDSRSIKIGG